MFIQGVWRTLKVVGLGLCLCPPWRGCYGGSRWFVGFTCVKALYKGRYRRCLHALLSKFPIHFKKENRDNLQCKLILLAEKQYIQYILIAKNIYINSKIFKNSTFYLIFRFNSFLGGIAYNETYMYSQYMIMNQTNFIVLTINYTKI